MRLRGKFPVLSPQSLLEVLLTLTVADDVVCFAAACCRNAAADKPLIGDTAGDGGGGGSGGGSEASADRAMIHELRRAYRAP
eukprot:scaffold22404_cov112-Isochrysis_galbana.AAC.4